MIIRIKDTDIKYLKNLCRYFNEMTAYVHEGVHITVDPFASVEIHEAAESLVKFRDKCIFPEIMEMLNNILVQLNGDPVSDIMDLKTVLDRTINDWFYMRQEELGIKDGAEPLDSMISVIETGLIKECNRVLDWQRDSKSVAIDNILLTQFYNTFDLAYCTCSGNKVTSYDLNQHCGDEPVKGFFDMWDFMVQAIRDDGRDTVLYYGHKLHSLINSMDTAIYDYKHGTWIDDYINWYLKEGINGHTDN